MGDLWIGGDHVWWCWCALWNNRDQGTFFQPVNDCVSTTIIIRCDEKRTILCVFDSAGQNLFRFLRFLLVACNEFTVLQVSLLSDSVDTARRIPWGHHWPLDSREPSDKGRGGSFWVFEEQGLLGGGPHWGLGTKSVKETVQSTRLQCCLGSSFLLKESSALFSSAFRSHCVLLSSPRTPAGRPPSSTWEERSCRWWSSSGCSGCLGGPDPPWLAWVVCSRITSLWCSQSCW